MAGELMDEIKKNEERNNHWSQETYEKHVKDYIRQMKSASAKLNSEGGETSWHSLSGTRHKDNFNFTNEVCNHKEGGKRDDNKWSSGYECRPMEENLLDDGGSHHENKSEDSEPILPMNDENGPYFIDEELVIMYQEGLEFKKWNPTQVVYELCSQMQWVAPEYFEHLYSLELGFLYSVNVNGCQFLADKRGRSKKISQHFASEKFLHFLGFKFEFRDKSLLSFELKHDQQASKRKRKGLENESNVRYTDLRDKIKANAETQNRRKFSKGILAHSTRIEHPDWFPAKKYPSDSRHRWNLLKRQRESSSSREHRISLQEDSSSKKSRWSD